MTKQKSKTLKHKRINSSSKVKKLYHKKQTAGLGPNGDVHKNMNRDYLHKKHNSNNKKYKLKEIKVQGFAERTDFEKMSDRKKRYSELKKKGETQLLYEEWVKNECRFCRKIDTKLRNEDTSFEKNAILNRISSRRCSDMDSECKESPVIKSVHEVEEKKSSCIIL
tara:strand:+ start:52 stop:549 length:498 start_codon:yes stop_codon:yes gene_type:complete